MKNGLITALTLMFTLTTFADEGMWLYNQPPRELLKKQYNFDATDEWLNHLQKSSVRFNSGGSGSFVSEDGLLITNHHVGADALQKLSTKDKNYVKDGFYARTQAEEVKCLDLELNVLQSIEDVTAQVNAAVPKNADPDTAFAARRKVIAGIYKDSLTKTGDCSPTSSRSGKAARIISTASSSHTPRTCVSFSHRSSMRRLSSRRRPG